jgi:hypothetical protein
MMLYGKDLGLNTKFAAPRPTVQAEPFTSATVFAVRVQPAFSSSLVASKKPFDLASSGFCQH